jgi:addiction module HigA family antidote
MRPIKLSVIGLARESGIPTIEINDIIDGRSPITDRHAKRLADRFENKPEWWLNLQRAYDEAVAPPLSPQPTARTTPTAAHAPQTP